MEPLIRFLTVVVLAVTAAHGLYAITVDGLWPAVLGGVLYWFGTGLLMILSLATGSWWVCRKTPAVEPSIANPQPELPIAGRIGPATTNSEKRAA